MKKLMNVWAKISSLIVIVLSLVGIYYALFGGIDSLASKVFIFIILFTLILFYPPLFYFAFSKNKTNKFMRFWAKAVTILYPVFIIISIFGDPNSANDLLINALSLISLVPLYYYGWKNKIIVL